MHVLNILSVLEILVFAVPLLAVGRKGAVKMLSTEQRIMLRLPIPSDLCKEIGSGNWVINRRTKRIVERYGEDVICLSRRQYDAAVDRALARLPKGGKQ